MSDQRETLVKATALTKYFPIRRGLLRRVSGHVRAVDGVDLDIIQGEVLGMVGESGSGKSTIGRLLLRLLEPTSGQVEMGGVGLTELGKAEVTRLRPRLQMVFQDSFASLNPRMSAYQTVVEPLVIHQIGADGAARKERVAELFRLVGLDERHLNRLPQELSGGQRQRVGIARALASDPEFVVADECLASLDVSVQAQIVNLLRELQESLSLTLLFITHDLRMATYLCDRVVVLYLGRVVEIGTTQAVTERPGHPYTAALLSASPNIPGDDGPRRARMTLSGEIPNPANPPTGCRFNTRCPHAEAICFEEEPELRDIDGRAVACHRAETVSALRTEPTREAS